MGAYGMTLPLITTASGKKFGKTEAGTVWLDPVKTSPYSFYQYWMNVDDRDVIRFLKFFSLLSLEDIEVIRERHSRAPEFREAQRALAKEMTLMVHGVAECEKVIQASRALFGEANLDEVDAKTLESALDSAPTSSYASANEMPPFIQVLVDVGLCESKSVGRRTIEAKGIYVNNQRVTSQSFAPATNDFLHGRFLVLRRGKKNYAVAKLGEKRS